MLQNEFEERTKLSITADEFNGINALYMACGDDIDKDVFCKLYMSFDGRLDLLHRIEREHQRIKDALDEENLLHREATEIVSDAADAMLEISSMENCCSHIRKELEKTAWWLVGTVEVIKRKVKRGIALTPNEVSYIEENLK